MIRPHFSKWHVRVSWTLAAACLLLIGWTAWQLAWHPDVGISWSFLTGTVEWVDPSGPAAAWLQPGDRLIAVDGIPVREAQFFPGKRIGDTVSFLVARDGGSQLIVVPLARAAPSEILLRLTPLLVALAFWSVGVMVLALSAPGHQGFLFFLFCQVSSATLASGSVAGIAPLWMAQLFGILPWWLSPLTLHFHLRFPSHEPSRYTRPLLNVLYLLAFLGSLPQLVWDPQTLHADATFPMLYAAWRLWLALGLSGAVFLLSRAFRRASTPEIRRQVGTVTLGGAMALIPFVNLFLIPYALLSKPLLPYEVAFLLLLFIPLAYGYAILRYRLMRLDRYVSRSATSVLVIALLGGLYVVLNVALTRVWQPSLANLVITLALAAAFGPMYQRLQIIVNRLFYGGWYDYRMAVQKVSQKLDSVTNSSAMAQSLSQAIQAAMQLECACLLLSDQKGNLTMSGIACQECAANDPGRLRLDASGRVARYFQTEKRSIETQVLREALKGARLSKEEILLLGCEHALLWLPLPGRDHQGDLGHPLGVLILGSKRGKGTFDADDLTILDVVTRQASLTFQNLRLIAELEERVGENERLYRQSVRAREEERKRVARELHDQIIQSLVMLNYHLSERWADSAMTEVTLRQSFGVAQDMAQDKPLVKSQPAHLQDQVRHILGDVRRICADLRPPVLDSMGLVSAVQSLVRELEAAALTVEGNPEQDLPDEVVLCLYRVLQEALNNAQKHAGAQRVNVRLRISPDEVFLSVEDDGRGFVMPERLGLLTGEGHFGLVGLRERVELVNGTLNITSAPGQGCRLEARVPLAGKQDEVKDDNTRPGRG